MLAKELIDRLERLGLLDQEIIETLRDQLESSGTRVTPEAIAKLLVDNGQLTKFQATKLIGELRSADYEDPDEADGSAVDEVPVFDGGDDLAMLDDVGAIEVEAVEVEAVEVADVFEVEAEPMEVEAVEVAEAIPMGDGAELGQAGGGSSRPKSARVVKQEKGTWDSFKIYGYAGAIVFLLLAGGGLYFVLNKGDADDRIAQADKLWDQSSWVPAQDAYIGFLESFGEGSQYASKCRTRITLAQLYRARDMRDPTAALDLAKEILPAIRQEEGLNADRSNLAGLLVEVAGNIAEAASEAEDTEEKKQLLGRLEEQKQLLEDSNYVTGTDRTNLAGPLASIDETRKRVRRDINRNIELEKSVVAMTAALGASDTKQAYDVRAELINEFPELRPNPRIVDLINQACLKQQELVVPSAKLPEVTAAADVEDDSKSVSLTTLQGGQIPGLEGQFMYRRVGGSVLAFSCYDGRLLWRRFVGYGQNHEPVRLEGDAGVLLSDAVELAVERCDGEKGTVSWRTLIEEPFWEPIASRKGVFVSTESGKLLHLDSNSGKAKWVQQIPQPLEVGACVDSIGKRLYLPGDHSNLYVLDTDDGSCAESFYIGHAKGTIAVPPVLLLGHLFVIVNEGSDYAMVHVLRVNDKDKTLSVAQKPMRVNGNVRVVPQVQKRRIIVLTDLGEISALEVEPTAENDKVSVVASRSTSSTNPSDLQMAVDGSQMWVTGNQLRRFDLQINTGRIVADWVKNPGDTFIGKPFVVEDSFFHSRVLKGTSAIRVTAADPKTGAEIWRTDVGVPIAMMAKHETTNLVHVVTSQGALFELSQEALMNGATSGPKENPGKQGIQMRFTNPVNVDGVKRIMLNEVKGLETMVYDPTRPREWLRKVVLAPQGGEPSGKACFAGGGLFVPMSTGRAVVMNYQTGGMLGSPFQPPSDPVKRVDWTDPLIHPEDPDQVLISDSRKKLYRLRVDAQINALSQVDLETPLLNEMTIVDSQLMAVTSGPAADFVLGFNATSLKEQSRTLLDGRVVWGPQSAEGLDGICFLQTADGLLRAFDSSGKQKYQVELPAGRPVGKPIATGDSVVIAGADGWIVVFDSATGEVKTTHDVGQPISATPLPMKSFLLVPGSEGVVFIVRL